MTAAMQLSGWFRCGHSSPCQSHDLFRVTWQSRDLLESLTTRDLWSTWHCSWVYTITCKCDYINRWKWLHNYMQNTMKGIIVVSNLYQFIFIQVLHGFPQMFILLTVFLFHLCHLLSVLTHWGQEKNGHHFPDDTFKCISLKMYDFRLRFHGSLFLRVQLTIFQHWFR